MSERPSRHQRKPSLSVFPNSLLDLTDISVTANPPSTIPSQPPRHQMPPPTPAAAPPANSDKKDDNASKEGNASSN
ncbi:BnaC03g71280D [Brassica napus]|uniref:(rape) hypothetical protein n=1 Tax=Brassica napus TaxID=3708 RepID=A0A078JT94_BRANA|nr:uncharacterized protein LOC106377114 [Brassica napus]CAF1696228.1 unnamed protein product [Brassica napus]CDY68647.1 BnaC03g71280D [Brassica napus]